MPTRAFFRTTVFPRRRVEVGIVVTAPDAAVNTKPKHPLKYSALFLSFKIKPPAVVKAIALIGSGTTMGEAMVETNMQATMAR